jgi:hypothetical protein
VNTRESNRGRMSSSAIEPLRGVRVDLRPIFAD